jgi:hypothetical protein
MRVLRLRALRKIERMGLLSFLGAYLRYYNEIFVTFVVEFKPQ